MIDLRTGQVGLAPLAAVLQSSPTGQVVAVVPSGAARISAETIALSQTPAQPHRFVDVRVFTPADLARSVLVAAGAAVPEQVDSTERWGLLRGFLVRQGISPERPGFPAVGDTTVVDVGRALDDARLASVGGEEIKARATADGAPAWLPVAALLDGWTAELKRNRVTDRVGLLCAAMAEARNPATVATWWANVDHLVVAEADRMPRPSLSMLASLLGSSRPAHTTARLWGMSVPVMLTGPLTGQTVGHIPGTPAPPQPAESLVRCGHPALEPEAAVGELMQAAGLGISWADMAVVAPSHDRLRAVARAARRAAVPISGAPAPRLDGPIVAGIAAQARLTHTQSLQSAQPAQADTSAPVLRPDQLMRAVVAERSDAVVGGTVEGEALVALLADATRHSHLSLAEWADHLDKAPAAPALPMAAPSDAVALCTIDELLDRVNAPLVTVLIGCVEGVLPSRRPTRVLDPAILEGPSGVLGADLSHLTAQRNRFASVASATASHGSVVYIAAPEPGVLVSRFTEGITAVAPTFPARHLDTERWPVGLAQTVNPRPLVSGGSLFLSASQINLFDNCPWQHTVQYRLNLRTEGGLQARFGTYIHTVLERFVAGIGDVETAPHVVPNPHGSTLEGLLTLADDCWTDDITDYSPQEDDYRGRAAAMLTDWWHRDGNDLVRSRRAAFTEYHFEVAVGEHMVTGFIDRIDVDPEGLSIIDYKTAAKAKSSAETNEDLQLAVYHLAANLDPALNSLGPVVGLNLDFLAENKQVAQRIQADHVQNTTDRIIDVANRMLAETALPSVEAACDYCDLARLCDLQPEGRAVPVRFGVRT